MANIPLSTSRADATTSATTHPTDHNDLARYVNLFGNSIINVKDARYGAVGDGSTNDQPAIQAAIDSITADTGHGLVFLPPGIYKLNSGLSWSNRAVHLMGACPANSQPFGVPAGTSLLVAAGVSAITFKNGPYGTGGRSIVENLHLLSQDSSSSSAVGIKLRAVAGAIKGCMIENFGSHGIHILSGQDGSPFVVDGDNNANLWYIERVRSFNNFGHGCFVQGIDSNAGNAFGLDCSGNDLSGIYDDSAFGNCYFGSHLDGNTQAAIRIGPNSGYNRFVGTYKEGDSNPAVNIEAAGKNGNYIDFRYLTGNPGETITNSGGGGNDNVITSTEGFQKTDKIYVGTADTGTVGVQVLPSGLFINDVSMSRVQAQVVALDRALQLPNSIASGSVPNDSLFKDSATSKLSYKDSTGGVLPFESRGLKLPVRVAAPVNITVSSPGATIDGVTMVAGDRVLLANQTTASQNGIYSWVAAASPMTRATDSDTAAKVTDSLLVTVDEGTVNKDSIFSLSTNKPVTLGSTSLRFTRVHPSYQVSSHPSNTAYLPANSKLENLDRTQIALANQALLATGTVRVFPMGILRAGDTLASINFRVGTTASASITNSWAGIARLSDRSVLAVSATSTATTAAQGLKTFTFGTPFTADKDETLVGFVMYQATTPPSLHGINHGDASIVAEAPVANGTSNTGATTPVAVAATLTAFTADTEQPYAYCS